jgi:hypothetical protein
MDISTISDRFEFYAINHKSIKHNPLVKKDTAFLLVDIQDVSVSVKTGLKFPCMFLQTPEVEKDGDMDSIYEHYEGSFAILKILDAGLTAAAKMHLFRDCKEIADEIYNRMLLDSDDYFEGAQIKTAEGAFGPIAGNVAGWGVNFGFQQGYDGEVNADKWEDLS